MFHVELELVHCMVIEGNPIQTSALWTGAKTFQCQLLDGFLGESFISQARTDKDS